jgi:hypothetical protein
MWYPQVTKLIIMQSSPFPCHLIPPPPLGQRRRYSDSLRAGRSGDRIPFGGRGLLQPSIPSVGHTQPFIKWVLGHSRW